MPRVYDEILARLPTLNPIHIELLNESQQHAGYFEGKESHFKLTLVSEDFAGMRAVARHQKVYAVLSDLMTSQGGNVHALALHTYTPEQWQQMGHEAKAPASPLCAGQNKPSA